MGEARLSTPARVAAASAAFGALLAIAGSFGVWAEEGPVTLHGVGGIQGVDTYRGQLEDVFAPGWLTLALAALALVSLALMLARGARSLALVADVAGTGALAVAIVSIVDITGATGDPLVNLVALDLGWGVIAVAAGGLIVSISGSLLWVFSASAPPAPRRPPV